jgi:hypothetical protein
MKKVLDGNGYVVLAGDDGLSYTSYTGDNSKMFSFLCCAPDLLKVNEDNGRYYYFIGNQDFSIQWCLNKYGVFQNFVVKNSEGMIAHDVYGNMDWKIPECYSLTLRRSHKNKKNGSVILVPKNYENTITIECLDCDKSLDENLRILR